MYLGPKFFRLTSIKITLRVLYHILKICWKPVSNSPLSNCNNTNPNIRHHTRQFDGNLTIINNIKVEFPHPTLNWVGLLTRKKGLILLYNLDDRWITKKNWNVPMDPALHITSLNLMMTSHTSLSAINGRGKVLCLVPLGKSNDNPCVKSSLKKLLLYH